MDNGTSFASGQNCLFVTDSQNWRCLRKRSTYW